MAWLTQARYASVLLEHAPAQCALLLLAVLRFVLCCLPANRTSGPSPVTCVDFDVLLPVKLQEKVAPAIDPLLDDKQVLLRGCCF